MPIYHYRPTEAPGVHYTLIFNTTDTSEQRTAELSPKNVRNSEVLLLFRIVKLYKIKIQLLEKLLESKSQS